MGHMHLAGGNWPVVPPHVAAETVRRTELVPTDRHTKALKARPRNAGNDM
jgi:hypothetical protein